MMNAMQDKYYLPLATIPLAHALCYVPHFVGATVKVLKRGPKYNNDTPRTEKAEDYPKIVARAAGAHYNALEMFPFYAVALLLAKARKADAAQLTQLAVSHLKLRAIYMTLYIFGFNKLINAARTGAWAMLVKNILQIYGLALF